MMYLSELYGRIGQILREKGDMSVVRLQEKGLDNLTTDANNMWIPYSNVDFMTYNDGVSNKFVIGVPKN